MMHELLQRLAHFGGECALVILFILSVVNVAAIGERLWHFWKRRLNVDDFAIQLATLVRAGETARARTLAQQSENSVCVVVQAALTQSGNGLKAVRRALSVAMSKEQARLRSRLAIFRDLGRCALLTGFAGTLFDLLAINLSAIPDGAGSESVGYRVLQLAIAALAPSAAGLAVAVPAFIASALAKTHVERLLLACDFAAQMLVSHLPASTPYRKHGDPHSKAA